MDLRCSHDQVNHSFHAVRNIAFSITVVLTLIGLGALFTKGLNFGLDFTGGTLIELQYEQPANLELIKAELGQAGYTDAVVQSFGASTDVLVRLAGDSPDLGNEVAAALRKVDEAARFEVKRVEFVGPQVGEELRDQGGIAMLLALGGIMLYLAFRFQWKFGVGAIASLVHDVIITFGIFTLLSMSKIWNEAFLKPHPAGRADERSAVGMRPAVWAVSALAVMTVAIGLGAGPLIDYAVAAAAQLADPQAYLQPFTGAGGI